MTDVLPGRHTDLHIKLWTEFQEMPGLRLTLGQASRLLDADPGHVVTALDDLIDAAVLRRVGPYYVRADWGRYTA